MRMNQHYPLFILAHRGMLALLQAYGWHIVFAFAACYFLYGKLSKVTLPSTVRKEAARSSILKDDMQAVRERQQAKLAAEAAARPKPATVVKPQFKEKKRSEGPAFNHLLGQQSSLNSYKPARRVVKRG
jgi:hypothetical protein